MFNYVLGWVFIAIQFHSLSAQPSEAPKAFSENDWENAFANDTSSIIPLFRSGGKSYCLITHLKATYLEADQFCRTMHMKLVSIRSKEENEFIYKLVQNLNKDEHYWTSGSRWLDGKNWIWMSYGEPLEYTNWAPGQPDSQGEYCLELWWFRQKGLLWNDRDCNARYSFVCERDESRNNKNQNGEIQNWPNLFQNPSVSPNINTLNYKEKNYYVGNIFKATFLEAIQFCQMIDMELVTISNDDENSRLHKYIRDTNAGDSFWTAGTKLIDGNTWIWLSTGEKVEYTHWLTGRPDGKTAYCIEARQIKDTGLQWNDLGCGFSLYFICQKRSRKQSWPVRPDQPNNTIKCPNPTCPIPTQPKKKTYYLGVDTKATNAEAITLCQKRSMQLASIQTQENNLAVFKLLHESNVEVQPFWTSGNRLADGKTWYWLNGDQIVYFNWLPGEPNNLEGNEKCIEVNKREKDVGWNDRSCDTKLYYICESVETTPGNPHCNAQPIVNVYVNNNVFSQNGTITDSKKILGSSTSNHADSYNVQVNNNINGDKKVEPRQEVTGSSLAPDSRHRQKKHHQKKQKSPK